MYHITKKGDETVVEEGKRTLPKWADMSLVMLKIGLFTFGGGWSIVAQMQKEFVEKRGWLGEEELLDIVAIGRSFPGIMVVNTAVMLGYRIGGVGCAFLCAFGMAFPAFVVMAAVTTCYTAVRDNPWVARAMVGVRAVVVPIILSACLGMRKSAVRDRVGLGIAVLAFLGLLAGVSNLYIIFLGGFVGLAVQTLLASRQARLDQGEEKGGGEG